jgi:ADP-ribosylglycohydrolase
MTNYSTPKIRNAIFGMAYGDAWGKNTEFDDFSRIVRDQPSFPLPLARITDDTQMSLYAMKAILKGYDSILVLNEDPTNRETKRHVRLLFAREFLNWEIDPRNNRAPGMTCMGALQELRQRGPKTGLEGTRPDSKGCGANMRNPWFGLLPLEEDTIEELSLLQSEVTHSHPLALSSAVLTALCLHAIYTGEVVLSNKMALYAYAVKKTRILIHKNEKRIDVRPAYAKGLELLEEFLVSRKNHVLALQDVISTTDVCRVLDAQGWVAEEALLLAITITDLHANEPEEGLRRGVYTNGDSDSIAAITGAFIGASNENNIFSKVWYDALEKDYREELEITFKSLAALPH